MNKRSLVTMVWDDDPTKRVILDVPFGTGLGDLREHADAALKAHVQEAAQLTVKEPA